MALDTSDPNANMQFAYQRLLALERFKSGFLARTAHELRSPINTIVSLHQLILEDLCEDPAEEKEFLLQSKAAALKMLALFDCVAAVAKLDVGREPPKLAAVDLSFLLPEVEMLTALQATNENVRYSVESPATEVIVHTDGNWLKNILLSLIQDAIAHTKVLRLAIESDVQSDQKTEKAVAVVIECDRSADDLQRELDSIADALTLFQGNEAPSVEPNPPLSLAQIENLQLSTGLVLATAHTALPAIQGKFSILPHPTESGRSRLICAFFTQNHHE